MLRGLPLPNTKVEILTSPARFCIDISFISLAAIALCVILVIHTNDLQATAKQFTESLEESLHEISKKSILDTKITDYITIPLNWDDFVGTNETTECTLRACTLNAENYVPAGLLISGHYEAAFIRPCASELSSILATSHKDSVHLSIGGPFNGFKKLVIQVVFNCSEIIYGDFIVPYDSELLFDREIMSCSKAVDETYLPHYKKAKAIISVNVVAIVFVFMVIFAVLFDIFRMFVKLSSRHYD